LMIMGDTIVKGMYTYKKTWLFKRFNLTKDLGHEMHKLLLTKTFD
jgi:hypothetical protein